jgi:hypothetical protein
MVIVHAVPLTPIAPSENAVGAGMTGLLAPRTVPGLLELILAPQEAALEGKDE